MTTPNNLKKKKSVLVSYLSQKVVIFLVRVDARPFWESYGFRYNVVCVKKGK